MHRRCDQVVIPDPSFRIAPHSAGERQVIPSFQGLVISEVPHLWRKYAREPWRILFPDLEWTPPGRDE